MEENAIGIVGTGQMGKQLTLFMAQRDYNVIVKSRTEKGAADVKKSMEAILNKLHGPSMALVIIGRVKFTSDFKDISACPLVFESVVEDYIIKKSVLKDIFTNVAESAIVASNTSSLSISKLSEGLENPGRFLGVHFFNPVHKMKLVELVRGKHTAEDNVQMIKELMIELDKDPVIVQDTPGFIVNRLLLPFINESVILVERGALPKDIDKAVRLGLNHPMGPLELADLIGIDTCISILQTLNAELDNDQYAPAMLMSLVLSTPPTSPLLQALSRVP